MKCFLGCLAAGVTLLAGGAAFASTDCEYSVDRVYYGTATQIYVIFGVPDFPAGTLYVDPTMAPASKDKFFSMLLTAKATNRRVTVRYPGTNMVCTGEHAELEGMWLD